MLEEILAGKRGLRTADNPYGWYDIDIKSYKLGSKPLVLCFGGDGTNGPKDASIMAVYAEQLLGRVRGNDDSIDVVSVYYKDLDTAKSFNCREYHIGQYEDERKFSEEEKNPQYIKDFYQSLVRPAFFDDQNKPLPTDELKKIFRNINILNFCHGDYVSSKTFGDYAAHDMKQLGYNSGEIADVLRQVNATTIVPQSDLKKTYNTKVAFGAIDDYHFSNNDALEVSGYYDLDSNINSYIGIIERPRETKSKHVKLYLLDNMLDYDNENDRFDAWMGKDAEDMHQVKSYIDMEYQNNYGKKSEEGKNFARLIAKSLQASVSNSCLNQYSEELVPYSLDGIASSEPLAFNQNRNAVNKHYMKLDVGDVFRRATAKGLEVDKKVYGDEAGDKSVVIDMNITNDIDR